MLSSACFKRVFTFLTLLVGLNCQAAESAPSVVYEFMGLRSAASGEATAEHAKELLNHAEQTLQNRGSVSFSSDQLYRFYEASRRNEEIKSAKGLEAEKLKNEDRLWQTKLAQTDLNNILLFHLTADSEMASRLQWFWSNHFNVYGMERNVRLALVDYDANALSPNITGKFSDLLVKAVLHPAMIIYLDNHSNRKSKGNENLAREILELHTLGLNSGYTQRDVQELARALTGITVVGLRTDYTIETCKKPKCIIFDKSGTILDLSQHDMLPKTVLGKVYTQKDGTEIEEILKDIALNDSTYKFISKKLLQYFTQDKPDDSDVLLLSSVLKKTNGSLSAAYLEIMLNKSFHSDEKRFSDPFYFTMRIARVLRKQGVDPGTEIYSRLLKEWGQGLYLRITPDGYPMDSTYWNSASALMYRLEGLERLLRGQEPRTMFNLADYLRKKYVVSFSNANKNFLKKYEKDYKNYSIYSLLAPELVFY